MNGTEMESARGAIAAIIIEKIPDNHAWRSVLESCRDCVGHTDIAGFLIDLGELADPPGAAHAYYLAQAAHILGLQRLPVACVHPQSGAPAARFFDTVFRNWRMDWRNFTCRHCARDWLPGWNESTAGRFVPGQFPVQRDDAADDGKAWRLHLTGRRHLRQGLQFAD
jgi:hypothetical protein